MGKRRARRVHARRAARRGLRPALRRVLAPARLLRPRRERRDAPPAGDQAGRADSDRSVRRASDAADETIAESCARRCARLHGELVRWGLVTWTSGNVSGRVRARTDGHQAQRDRVRRADARVDGGHRPRRPAGRRRARPVVGHARPTPTSTASCPTSTGSSTPTAPTPRRGPPVGEAIPCVLTAMADEFGGEIPIAPFARIGDEEIGAAVVSTLARPPLAGRAAAQPWRVHDRRHARRRRSRRR